MISDPDAALHELGHACVPRLYGVDAAITNEGTHFITWKATAWQTDVQRLAFTLGGTQAGMMSKDIISAETYVDDLTCLTLSFLEANDDGSSDCDAATARNLIERIDNNPDVQAAFLVARRAASLACELCRDDPDGFADFAKAMEGLASDQCLVLPPDAPLGDARVEIFIDWLLERQETAAGQVVTRKGSFNAPLTRGQP